MHIDVTNPPHIHCWFDFDWIFFSLSLKLWRCILPRFIGIRLQSEWRVISIVIFKFDIDVTSLWWKSQTSKSACSSWSWTLSNLVLSHLSNSRTLVILLQVDPASSDKPETVYEGYYEIEYISIFAWFPIIGVGHYRWLCGLICRLPPNSKVDYLIRTIRRILNFLPLWTIIVA